MRLLVPLLALPLCADAGLITIAGGRGVAAEGGGGDLPAWFENQTSKTWLALDTQLADVDPCPADNCSYSVAGHTGVIDNWAGAVATPTTLVIAAQGGHNGYAGNEAYLLDLSSETPAWDRDIDPSTSVQQNVAYYADGKPTSRHGYGHQIYIPSEVTNGNRWFAPFGYGIYNLAGGTSTDQAASYVIGSGAYDAQDFFADWPGSEDPEGCVAYDPSTELVWIKEAAESQAGGMFSFNPETDTYSSRQGSWAIGQGDPSCAIDPIRNIFAWTDGTAVWAVDLDNPSDDPIEVTTSGTGVSDNGPGFIYDPVCGCFLGWASGATVRKLTPAATWQSGTWVWAAITNAGGGDTPTSAEPNGTYGRLNYLSALHALVVVNAVSQDAYVYKLPATQGAY